MGVLFGRTRRLAEGCLFTPFVEGSRDRLGLQPFGPSWYERIEIRLDWVPSGRLAAIKHMDDSTFDVFLSHNSQDKPAVKDLFRALEGRGLRVWLDESELQPGLSWQQGLDRGIRSSKAVVVVIGKDGLGPWEVAEMEGALILAVDNNIPVVPVLLPGAPGKPKLPLFLTSRTWVDLRGGLTTEGLDRVQWGITGVKPDGWAESAGSGQRIDSDTQPPEAGVPNVDFGRGIHLGTNRPWQGWTDESVTPKTPAQLDAYRRELVDADCEDASQASRAAHTAHVLAMALRSENQDDEAAAMLGRALQLGQRAVEIDRLKAQLGDEFFGRVHNTLGTIRLRQGRRDDAVGEFRKAIDLDRTNAAAYHNLGMLLMAHGPGEEGVSVLENAAALQADRAAAHFQLGLAYSELGRLDQAAQSLARAAELASDWDRDYYRIELGKVLLEAGEPERALTVFASARTHMSGVARVGEAIALRLADRLDDAARVLAETIDSEPQLADAHGELGITYWQLGRTADAVAALRRAAKLSADDPEWHVNLALALGAEGRAEEARIPLERALSIDPENDAARSELARLPAK